MSNEHAGAAGAGRTSSPLAGRRVLVTGGSGFLGRSIGVALRARGIDPVCLSSANCDLTDQRATRQLLNDQRPELIIHAAAAVGGIGAHKARSGHFCYANTMMLLNVVEQSRLAAGAGDPGPGIVNIASAAVYPERAAVPFKEETIWEGAPEPVSAGYGVAKRFGLTLLDTYRVQHGTRAVTLLPINLYGPGDHLEPERSHVVSALVRRFCEAVECGQGEVVCWGSGEPTREFLYVDDAAEGIVLAAERLIGSDKGSGDALAEAGAINLGTGQEVRIAELAEAVARAAGFTGRIGWDRARPDGHARRSVDTGRARELLGWSARTPLDAGLARTVGWFRSLGADARSSG